MSDQNKVPAALLFQRAWGLYKHAFARLFPIAFATFALASLYRYTIMTQLVSSSSMQKTTTVAIMIASQLVFFCMIALSQNAQLFTLQEHYMNQQTPFRQIIKQSAARFIPMLALILLLLISIQVVAFGVGWLISQVLPAAMFFVPLLVILISTSFVLFSPCILLFEKQNIMKSIRFSIQRCKSIWRSNFFLLLPPLLAYMLVSSILANINNSLGNISAAGFGIEEVVTIFTDALIFPFLITLIFTQYIHYLPKATPADNQDSSQNQEADKN
ncbi:hypothetical protein [Piscirickettsia salmonis]|uniref:hypothetical protein n=1 Tax=Piscirickettsia salmonis TaxID=1238 RepID=UPI0007C95E46|nr:hypothetical protein A0O36_01623 [Piscirickettsiaceae bacterium NZ-RLO1]